MFLSRYHTSDEKWMTRSHLSQTHSYFLYWTLVIILGIIATQVWIKQVQKMDGWMAN